MTKAQCNAANGGSTAEIEDDLEILKEMEIIDEDFNAWSEFRSEVGRRGEEGGRGSMESLATLSAKWKSSGSNQGGDGSHTKEKVKRDKISDAKLQVSFSRLTRGEKRDIRAWEIRLARETVFSRYYFPEQWEVREMTTLQEFLDLKNPTKSPSFLDEPGQERTKKAVTAIFFPGDHDPKSVLLKRGPILSDGVDERELLLFTHGFLLSRLELDSLLNILFTINSENPEFLSSKELRARFNAIDSDGSGCLDRCEMKEVFNSMGVPIGEQALSEIMDRFDTDNDGTIDCDEFEAALQSHLKPKIVSSWNWGATLGSISNKVRQSFVGNTESKPKLDSGYLFSDVVKIESTNVCYSESTQMFAKSSWADLVVAIFVKGEKDPLVLVCSKPEARLAWVDAFRTCYVKSIQLRASSGSKEAKKIRGQVGWQHGIIRASIFSLVVSNELDQLEELVADPYADIDIDDQDEEHGYTALHYAVALGNMSCANLLLQHGAEVNIKDKDQKTPLDLAALSENRDMSRLLERHGAQKHSSEVLFKSAVAEQNELKSRSPRPRGGKTMEMAKGATGAIFDAMSALRERGERIEHLDNKAAQLNSDAANYADMAKQMKEKNKQKAKYFGM
mmetsp:Transcript_14754/g.31269  ORF Transcript_14754/g.31269 Transcript_14754/m.31269 type:complete len:619 (-) Transcript_14754:64-1920(-)